LSRSQVLFQAVEPLFPADTVKFDPVRDLGEPVQLDLTVALPTALVDDNETALERILMCLEIAGRLMSKWATMRLRVRGCWASKSKIALRVGSAIAWKTSLLVMNM